MKNFYDVVVVGLGAIGSAALYQLSKRGAKVLGIDQLSPPHNLGSSGGETRLVRQAIGEGEPYVELALESYEIWRELEKHFSQKLLYQVGGLVIAPSDDPFFLTTVAMAKKFHIAHEMLKPEDIQSRFPQFRVEANSLAYYEKNAGYVIPERCIEAQIRLAEQQGAYVQSNESVKKLVQEGEAIAIHTAEQKYYAQKIIIAAGSSIGQFLASELQPYFSIYRQVLYWLDVDKEYFSDFARSPVYIWKLPDKKGGIYGFPAINGPSGGMKIATHNMDIATDFQNLNRLVEKQEKQSFYQQFVKPYFFGVGPACLRALVCTYTATPDENFVIDEAPNNKNILLVSACSGHGFKHSAAVGKRAALWVESKSLENLSHFSWKRFKHNSGT